MEMEKEKCLWKMDYNEQTIQTSCDVIIHQENLLKLETHNQSAFTYCPYCGKEIYETHI